MRDPPPLHRGAGSGVADPARPAPPGWGHVITVAVAGAALGAAGGYFVADLSNLFSTTSVPTSEKVKGAAIGAAVGAAVLGGAGIAARQGVPVGVIAVVGGVGLSTASALQTHSVSEAGTRKVQAAAVAFGIGLTATGLAAVYCRPPRPAVPVAAVVPARAVRVGRAVAVAA